MSFFNHADSFSVFFIPTPVCILTAGPTEKLIQYNVVVKEFNVLKNFYFNYFRIFNGKLTIWPPTSNLDKNRSNVLF